MTTEDMVTEANVMIEKAKLAMSVPSGFDYENQAWVVDGRYIRCGHPDSMSCGCFGRKHEGEAPAANANIH